VERKMTDKEHGHEALKLNGITLDQGMQKLVDAYLIHAAHGDTAVPTDHPVLARQDNLTTVTEGIEKIVKDALGDSKRLDPHNSKDVARADSLMKSIAYEFAKTRKYSGKIEDMTDDDVIKYLAELGNATQDPTVGNMVEFKKSLLNAASLKPGTALYNRDSPIGHAIQYIATQKEEGSGRLQHIQTLFQQHASNPEYVTATAHALSHATGKHYGRGATMSELLGDLRQAGELQAQQWAQQKSKTYTAPTQSAHSIN
jgi:hypothetical protein